MPIFIDEYSCSAFPIEMLCNRVVIGTATGFFYGRAGALYLVSNWHVLSGRNARTGQSLRSDAAIPNGLQFPLHRKQLGHLIGGLTVPLFHNEERNETTWWQHPRGQTVDVALIEINRSTLPMDCQTYELPRPNEANHMRFQVSMDAFVLGYPIGVSNEGVLPIWKRASIATETNLPHRGLPLFLIDTATRAGMSGAPVFIRAFGGYDREDGDRVIGAGAFTRFVGVYSGRHGADDEEAVQLGRVWHRSVIDEIIDAKVQGTYEIAS